MDVITMRGSCSILWVSSVAEARAISGVPPEGVGFAFAVLAECEGGRVDYNS